MKKFNILILILLIFNVSYAKIQQLSSLPPAEIEYVDLEPNNCDLECLKTLVEEKKIFSFLSRYDEEVADENLKSIFATSANKSANFLAIDNMTEKLSKDKIAVLLPEKSIGGYSHVVSDSVFSYIVSENIDVSVKFYLTGTEDPNSLMKAINNIKRDGISLVVAPVTARGAKFLAEYSDSDTLFFIPTIHYKMVENSKGNIFFGGIDYEKQVNELLKISNLDILLLHDGSSLSKMINDYIALNGGEVSNSLLLSGVKTSLLGRVNSKSSTAFLNLPLNSTAKAIYDLKVDNKFPQYLLTTQINYAPKLLSLVDYSDRKNLYIANSITSVPSDIAGVASLLDLDIYYNWVAYSTMIGIDYLYSTFVNSNHQRVFKELVVGSGIDYDTQIYKTDKYKFKATIDGKERFPSKLEELKSQSL